MSTGSPCLVKLIEAPNTFHCLCVVESPDGLRCHVSIGESTIIDNANAMNIASELINFIMVSFRWFMNKIVGKFNH